MRVDDGIETGRRSRSSIDKKYYSPLSRCGLSETETSRSIFIHNLLSNAVSSMHGVSPEINSPHRRMPPDASQLVSQQ